MGLISEQGRVITAIHKFHFLFLAPLCFRHFSPPGFELILNIMDQLFDASRQTVRIDSFRLGVDLHLILTQTRVSIRCKTTGGPYLTVKAR